MRFTTSTASVCTHGSKRRSRASSDAFAPPAAAEDCVAGTRRRNHRQHHQPVEFIRQAGLHQKWIVAPASRKLGPFRTKSRDCTLPGYRQKGTTGRNHCRPHPLLIRQNDDACGYVVRPCSLLANLIAEQIQGRAMLLRQQCPAADIGDHLLRQPRVFHRADALLDQLLEKKRLAAPCDFREQSQPLFDCRLDTPRDDLRPVL